MNDIEAIMEIASEINTSFTELLDRIEQLRKDENITTNQKHLIVNQVRSTTNNKRKELDDVVDRLLDDIKIKNDVVEGLSAGRYYISGLRYQTKKRRSVEILNKDSDSWKELVKLLVKNDLTDLIQQRLTVSKVNNNVLEKMCGMINISEKEYISISK